jgi:hypothetical protein
MILKLHMTTLHTSLRVIASLEKNVQVRENIHAREIERPHEKLLLPQDVQSTMC